MIRFAYPWAFLALLSVPLLIAIYTLIGRSKRHVVSSLLLWTDVKTSAVGGRRFERLNTPLTFFLELLFLVLLIMAAAGPQWRGNSTRRPLVVILDQSFSMDAGGEQSAHAKGLKAVSALLDDKTFDPVHFVLAGQTPHLYSSRANNANAWREAWTCTDIQADLDRAMVLGRDLGGPRACLLVVSDHKPAFEIEAGDLQWWAMGKARPNIGFVTALRGAGSPEARILLEIANFADRPARVRLNSSHTDTEELDLEAGGRHRLSLSLSDRIEVLAMDLEDDALPFDNHVDLVRSGHRRIKVRLAFSDALLASRVERALSVTGRVDFQQEQPDLLVTDLLQEGPSVPWVFQFRQPVGAQPLLGPFVLNQGHPLLNGLSLGGVVWGAKGPGDPAAVPLMLAGNATLLEEMTTDTQTRFHIYMDSEWSNLHESPNWPILFHNLVAHVSGQMPGVAQANVRAGAQVKLRLAEPGQVVLTSPLSTEVLQAFGRDLVLPVNQVGLFRVQGPGVDDRFAVNPLQFQESDLRGSSSGRWGQWAPLSGGSQYRRDLVWPWLIGALLLLILHQVWLRRSGDGVLL